MHIKHPHTHHLALTFAVLILALLLLLVQLYGRDMVTVLLGMATLRALPFLLMVLIASVSLLRVEWRGVFNHLRVRQESLASVELHHPYLPGRVQVLLTVILTLLAVLLAMPIAIKAADATEEVLTTIVLSIDESIVSSTESGSTLTESGTTLTGSGTTATGSSLTTGSGSTQSGTLVTGSGATASGSAVTSGSGVTATGASTGTGATGTASTVRVSAASVLDAVTEEITAVAEWIAPTTELTAAGELTLTPRTDSILMASDSPAFTLVDVELDPSVIRADGTVEPEAAMTEILRAAMDPEADLVAGVTTALVAHARDELAQIVTDDSVGTTILTAQDEGRITRQDVLEAEVSDALAYDSALARQVAERAAQDPALTAAVSALTADPQVRTTLVETIAQAALTDTDSQTAIVSALMQSSPDLTDTATTALAQAVAGDSTAIQTIAHAAVTEAVTAPESEPLLQVRLIHRDGQVVEPAYHFVPGSVVLVLDPLPRFTPGLYTLEVTVTNPLTGEQTVQTQDFAWGVLALNADQDRYRPGDTAFIAIGVLDDAGEMLCDADVTLAVTDPEGSTTTLGTDDSSIMRNRSVCEAKNPTNVIPDYQANYTFMQSGTYTLTLSARTLNGERSITSRIQVADDWSVTVRRTAATRLYPIGDAPMGIEVTFAEDFAGQITDVLPEGFSVTNISGNGIASIQPDGSTLVTWQGAWSAGTVVAFTYDYDAPDVSPEYYLVGPLTLRQAQGDREETELRAWQIANDAPANITGRVFSDTGATLPVSGVTVAASLNGAAVAGTASTDANGSFTITGLTFTGGTIVTLFVDGTTTNRAVSVSHGSGSSMTGMTLIKNTLVIQSGTGGSALGLPITSSELALADNSADTDITGIYTMSSNNLTIVSGKRLEIRRGGVLNLGGTLTSSFIHLGAQSGSLVQNSNTITVNRLLSQSGGTFLGSLSSATIDINGSINVDAGSFRATNGTLSLGLTSGSAPQFIVADGSFAHNSGTIAFDGNAGWYINAGTNTLNDVTVNGAGSSGTAFFRIINTLYIDDDLTITAVNTGGSPIYRYGTVRLRGDLTLLDTSLDAGTGTLIFDGAGDQTLGANGGTGAIGALLKLDKPSGTLYVQDTIDVAGGWEYIQGNTSFASTSNFRVRYNEEDMVIEPGPSRFANVTVNTGNCCELLTISGSWIITGNYTSSLSYYLNGGPLLVHGNVIALATTAYGDLPMRLIGTGSQIVRTITNGDHHARGQWTIAKPSGTVTLSGALSLPVGTADLVLTGGTLDLNGFNLTVQDQFIVGTGTTLRLTGNETISGGPDHIHRSSFLWYDAAGSTRRLKTFTKNYQNLIIGSTGSAIFQLPVAGLSMSGSLTLSGGTLQVDGGQQFTLSGSWTKTNGSFSAGTGTVRLAGGDQTILGSNTFNHLTKAVTTSKTLTFGAGSTQTVGGTLTLSGLAGNLLRLRSSSPGSQWSIDPQGTRTLSYVDVQDSSNTNGTIVTCSLGCSNAGNNTNWTFPTYIYGRVYSNTGATTGLASVTVTAALNGGAKAGSGTTDSNGNFSIAVQSLTGGSVVALYIDGHASHKAVTVSKGSGSTMTGMTLIKDTLVIQSGTGGSQLGTPVTTANLATAKLSGSSDADITSILSTATTSSTVTATGKRLEIRQGGVLNLGGTLTIGSSGTSSNLHLSYLSGSLIQNNNAITVNGPYTQSGGTFRGSSSTSTIDINARFLMEGGTFQSTAGTLYIGSGLSGTTNVLVQTGGTFSHNSGTVEFDAPGGCAVPNPYTLDVNSSMTFNHVRVTGAEACGDNGTPRWAVATNDSLIVSGNLTLLDGVLKSGAWIVFGNVITGSNTDDRAEATATITMSGAGIQTIRASGGSGWLPAVIINKPGGSVLLQDTLKIGHSWTWTSGTVNAGSGTIQFGGAYNNEASITIAPGPYAFNNVIVNIYNSCCGNIHLNINGTLAVDGTLTLDATDHISSGEIRVKGNIINRDTSLGGTTRLLLVGTGSQTIYSITSADYPDALFTIAKPSGTVTLSGALSVNASGQDLIMTGGTLDLNGYNITVNDQFTVGTGTTLRLTGNETITGGPDHIYKNATIWYDESSVTRRLKTFGSKNYQNLVIGSTGSAIFQLPTAGLSMSGSLTLSGGTLQADGGQQLTLSGSWTKTSGSFSAGTGTVRLAGGDQSILGSNTFYNLTKSVTSPKTLTFGAGSTQTVGGTLTLNGATSNLLKLRSTVAGSQWRLDPQGTRTVSHLNVKDSNNIHATAIDCSTGCVSLGNNTNWTIPPSITGTAYSNTGATLPLSGKTVAVSINGAATAQTTTTESDGFFAFSGLSFTGGSVITLFLDGNTEKAVTVSRGSSSAIADMTLIRDTLVIQSGTGGAALGNPVTTQSLAVAKLSNSSDTDISAILSTATTSSTVTANGKRLEIRQGGVLNLGGTLTVGSYGSYSRLHLSHLSGSLIQNNSAITVNGPYTQSGGAFIGSSGGAAMTITTGILSTGFTQDGGTFTATSGQFSFRGPTFTSTGSAVFNHNNGLLYVYDGDVLIATTFDMGSREFNDVTLYLSYNLYGDLNVVDDFRVGGPASSYLMGAFCATVTLQGDLILNKGAVVCSSAAVTLNGTLDQTIDALAHSPATLTNITINKASGTVLLKGNIGIYGTWNRVSGTINAGTGTLTFAGANGVSPSISDSQTLYNDVELNTPTYSLTVSGALHVGRDFLITSGVNITGGPINVYRNLISRDTAIGGTAALHLVGSGAQIISTIASGDYPNGTITIAKPSGVATLSGALTLNTSGQDLFLTGGTLNLNGNNLTVNDRLEVGTGTTFRLRGTETISGGPDVFHTNSTVWYDAPASSVTLGNWSYKNLVIGSPGSATFTPIAALTVPGSLTVSGGTLRTGNQTISVTGNFDLQNSGTLRLRGTESVTTPTSVSKNSTVWYDAPSGSVTLKNLTYGNLVLGSTGSAVFSLPASTLDVDGNMTLSGGTLNPGSNTITLSGSWLRSGGTFTAGTSTFQLNGRNQTLSGSTSFYNLTKSASSASTLTFAAGTTQTVTNALTFQGADSALLSLRSSQTGTRWKIDPQGTRTVSYLDVKDSENMDDTAILCLVGCANSGNNVGWSFPLSGTVYQDEGVTPASGVKVMLSVNGAYAGSGTTDVSGFYTVAPIVSIADGDTVTAFLSGSVLKGATVVRSIESSLDGYDLYAGRLVLRDRTNTSITNAHLDTADTYGGSDLTSIFTASGGRLSVYGSNELFIRSGTTFRPTGDLNTDDMDINGTLAMGTGTVTVRGSWDATDGSFSSGSVILTSGSAETITTNGSRFQGLAVSGAGTWNMQDALSVRSALTLTASGSLDLNGNALSLTGATFSNTATLRLKGSEVLNSFVNDEDSGTILFDGTGSYTGLRGMTSFHNLTLNGAGNWVLNAAIDVNNDLLLATGSLDSMGYAVTVGGSWNNTQLTDVFTERTGTVTLDRTSGTGTITEPGSFYALVMSGASTAALNVQSNLDINGPFTLRGGTLAATNQQITVSGSWLQSRSGALSPGTSTVTLDGRNQTVSGSTVFYNLRKLGTNSETLTFTAGATQTVRGMLTLTGSSANYLTLRSSIPGTQWKIDPQGVRTMAYVIVNDSWNTNAAALLCSNDCVNNGNNTNWAFPITVTARSATGALLGSGVTLALSVNGGTAVTATTNALGEASFITVSVGSGDLISTWFDGEDEDGVTVTRTNGTSLGFEVYDQRLVIRHEVGSGITNANLDTALVGDSDIDSVLTFSGSSLVMADDTQLQIRAGSTYAPGSNVYAHDMNIDGTFVMGSNTVAVSGSWDATGGIFTGSNTVRFTSTESETITSNGHSFNDVSFSQDGGSWTNTDAFNVTGSIGIISGQSGGAGGGAPIIANASGSLITDTHAVITWITSETATSKVVYGTASGTLSSVRTGTGYNTSHALTLSGLTANTLYYFRVASTDNAGNTSTGAQLTFRTRPTLVEGSQSSAAASSTTGGNAGGGGGGASRDRNDRTKPKISDIVVSSTASGTTIAWATDEGTSGTVGYGISSVGEYAQTNFQSLSVPTRSHVLTLTRLVPGTEYLFQIVAVDAMGNTSFSEEQAFTAADSDGDGELSETEKEAASSAVADGLLEEQLREAGIAKAAALLTNLSATMSLEEASLAEGSLESLIKDFAERLPKPILSGEPRVDVTATTAEIRWKSDKLSSSLVAFSPQETYNATKTYARLGGDPGVAVTDHLVVLTDLVPGQTYHYQLRSRTRAGAEAASADFTFTTLKKPLGIDSYTMEVISDHVAEFTWVTTEKTDTQISWAPVKNGRVNESERRTQREPAMGLEHRIRLEDLEAGILYAVEIGGKTAEGRQVSKVLNQFSTASGNTAPVISSVKIDVAILPGSDPKVQAIVSWETNELSSSQVFFQEGVQTDTTAELTSSTTLDPSLTRRHVAVLPDLTMGAIYSFQVESNDGSGNARRSQTFTVLTPRQQESVIQIIFGQMEELFGWMGDL